MTRVSFRRDKEDDPQRTVHLMKCQQKRVSLGFAASSSSRDLLGVVDMGERTMPMDVVPSPETDAMMLAAVRPHGHDEPHEVSRSEFESAMSRAFLC